MITEINLADVNKKINISYDNATIKQKIVLKNGEIFVGTFSTINNGKLLLQQDVECLDLQNYERNGIESFISSLKASCN